MSFDSNVNKNFPKVNNQITVPYIAGDGIGPEISQATIKVINSALTKVYQGKKKIIWKPLAAGKTAYKKYGEWLPQKTIKVLKKYPVSIKGPTQTPIGIGHRSINVTLRQTLDLYACVRPVEYFSGVKSPVKHPENVNMTIFRENTEGLYTGIDFDYSDKAAKDILKLLKENNMLSKVRFPKTSNFGIKPVSKEGTFRLVNSAIEYAIRHKKKKVTLVHKGNILKKTEGAFQKWGYEAAQKHSSDIFTMKEYNTIQTKQGQDKAEKALKKARETNKIIVDDVIADNFLQQILLDPQKFSVIATSNLNGDYISDALAAQVGGIGISPGANINYQDHRALFEATHGTAPTIAGKNIANPISLILSGTMMLSYLGLGKVASLIKKSIQKSIVNDNVTGDLLNNPKKQPLSTNAYANYLVKLIKSN